MCQWGEYTSIIYKYALIIYIYICINILYVFFKRIYKRKQKSHVGDYAVLLCSDLLE